MTLPASDDDSGETSHIYSVRVSMQASQDVIDAMLYLADAIGEVARAQNWKDDLYKEIGTLATLPHRYAARERETRLFGQPIRLLVYRQPRAMFAYLVFYSINEFGEDGPTVTILHIRHGSRKPPTRAEARQILGNL